MCSFCTIPEKNVNLDYCIYLCVYSCILYSVICDVSKNFTWRSIPTIFIKKYIYFWFLKLSSWLITPFSITDANASSTCLNIAGLVIASSLFLVAQLVVLLAWAFVWHKRGRGKSSIQKETSRSIDMIYNSRSKFICIYFLNFISLSYLSVTYLIYQYLDLERILWNFGRQ